MRWNLVRLADVQPQRWRNGGGTTRELLALPRADDWRLRISVAEVEGDGPFSPFPGVERWFAVLRGAGVRLVIGGVEHRVTHADSPLQFDGGLAADCKLVGGATQDLNLMVRGRKADMQRVGGARKFNYQARMIVAVYANAPASMMVDGERLTVDAATLAWRAVEEEACIEFEGDDALWMEIAP